MRTSCALLATVTLSSAVASVTSSQQFRSDDGLANHPSHPLMREEGSDAPPADWDDDAVAGAAAALPLQDSQWVSTDMGRRWAVSDEHQDDSSAAQVEYGAASLSSVGTGNISHTYKIDPHLLADMPDANAVCGTLDQVHDCGYSWLAPVCTDSSSTDCVRGVCICTSSNGCDKPICESSDFECHDHKPEPLIACKDGCLSKPGTGWSCWHPCNMQHEIEDYGAQAHRVKAIRATGVCGNMMTVQTSEPLESGDPELLKDIQHASGFCGSAEYVASCGYSHLDDVCTGSDCYKGVCICTEKDGCLEPQCKHYDTQCPAGLAECRSGKGCLVTPGSGWSCWHPCNLEHKVEEYGHQAGVVQAIRNSGNCTKIGVHITTGATTGSLRPVWDADASRHGGMDGLGDFNSSNESMFRADDETPGLDAGIMLFSQAYAMYSGESTVNAGGASRRRADKRHQPVRDTYSEVADVRNSWYKSMQAKTTSSSTSSTTSSNMYYAVGVLALFVAGLILYKRNSKEDATQDGPSS